MGYVKEARLKPKFWFEGTDGTRLGEIRGAKHWEIYDAQNQLRATIERKTLHGWKNSLFGKPEWRIEDPDGTQLAEVKGIGKTRVAEHQILAPDGSAIAKIHQKLAFTPGFRSYRIDISRQDLDPLLILSYATILAEYGQTLRSI